MALAVMALAALALHLLLSPGLAAQPFAGVTAEPAQLSLRRVVTGAGAQTRVPEVSVLGAPVMRSASDSESATSAQAGKQEAVPGQAGTEEAEPGQAGTKKAAKESESVTLSYWKTKKHAHLEQLQAWDGEGSLVSLVPAFHPLALEYCTAQALPNATLLLLPELFTETNHTYDGVAIDVSCTEACAVEYLVDGLVHVTLATVPLSGNSTVRIHLWDAYQHFKNTTYTLTVLVGDPHGHDAGQGLGQELLLAGTVLGCALVAVLASMGVSQGWFATGAAVVQSWAAHISGEQGLGVPGSNGPYQPLMGEPLGQGRT